MKRSLVEKTDKVIESISKMEFIKPYMLVGGTALSLQIENRQSEDLDFMRWQTRKGEPMNIDLNSIKKELEDSHTINNIEILDLNHMELNIDDNVRLSFYAPEKRPPMVRKVPYMNNLVLADVDTIAALKLETMQRRNVYRDYYDLYCIFKDKTKNEIVAIIENSLKYSQHHMKSKNLLGILCNEERFKKESDFKELNPKYNITSNEIADFMRKNVELAYRLKNDFSL